MSALVHLDVERAVATITLDSPANRNALSRQLVTELDAALATADADASVRAVVLTHTGPTFCAGADLREQAAPPPEGASRMPPVPALLTRILTGRAPVVAVLRGGARAGGIGLVAACDVAIAPASSTFAFTEVHIGVVPAMISVPIVRRMTARSVSRYFLTGEAFTAAEAVTAGLLTVATDDVDGALADVLAGMRRAEPAALARTRALIGEVAALDLADGFELAASVSAQFFGSEAAAEGMAAFADKRPPRWAT